MRASEDCATPCPVGTPTRSGARTRSPRTTTLGVAGTAGSCAPRSSTTACSAVARRLRLETDRTTYDDLRTLPHPRRPRAPHLVRYATLEDVRELEGRPPDSQDLAAVEAGGYVVVRDAGGTERLYHQAYLRADGGAREIADVVDTWPRSFTDVDFDRAATREVVEYHLAQPDGGRRWVRTVVVARTRSTIRVQVTGGRQFSIWRSQARRDLRWPARASRDPAGDHDDQA